MNGRNAKLIRNFVQRLPREQRLEGGKLARAIFRGGSSAERRRVARACLVPDCLTASVFTLLRKGEL